jgi:hypothetical protein
MHANASTSNQTAKMLAIILLNNSLLPDDTLTAAKLELVRDTAGSPERYCKWGRGLES